MSNKWKSSTLAEITTRITDGSHNPPKGIEQSEFLMLSSKNVLDDEIHFDNPRYLSADDFSLEHRRTTVAEGDVLLTIVGTIGRTAVVPGNTPLFALQRSVAVIKPRIDHVHPRFLMLALMHGADRLNDKARGVAQKGIYLEALREFTVRHPSLHEQQRIVAILDEAFDCIATAKANAEKNLQNARALFETYLSSMLLSKRWQWKTIGDVCEKVEYGSSAKSKVEGSVPVLRMGNIQDGYLDWEKLLYSDDRAEIEKYSLRKGDVLFNRTNSPELVGKAAIYDDDRAAIFAGYLIRIHRRQDLLDAKYLTYFLNSKIALDYGKTVMISSVNQANINGTKLKAYPIPLPLLIEQRKIVSRLDVLVTETQRLESIYQQKLAAMDELKKSLLHQAFSGAL